MSVEKFKSISSEGYVTVSVLCIIIAMSGQKLVLEYLCCPSVHLGRILRLKVRNSL